MEKLKRRLIKVQKPAMEVVQKLLRKEEELERISSPKDRRRSSPKERRRLWQRKSNVKEYIPLSL